MTDLIEHFVKHLEEIRPPEDFIDELRVILDMAYNVRDAFTDLNDQLIDANEHADTLAEQLADTENKTEQIQSEIKNLEQCRRIHGESSSLYKSDITHILNMTNRL